MCPGMCMPIYVCIWNCRYPRSPEDLQVIVDDPTLVRGNKLGSAEPLRQHICSDF